METELLPNRLARMCEPDYIYRQSYNTRSMDSYIQTNVTMLTPSAIVVASLIRNEIVTRTVSSRGSDKAISNYTILLDSSFKEGIVDNYRFKTNSDITVKCVDKCIDILKKTFFLLPINKRGLCFVNPLLAGCCRASITRTLLEYVYNDVYKNDMLACHRFKELFKFELSDLSNIIRVASYAKEKSEAAIGRKRVIYNKSNKETNNENC